MGDDELKRLIGSLIDHVQEQSRRMATKDDITALADRLDTRIDRLDTRIDGMDLRIGSIEARMATKDDLAALEARMATKDDLNSAVGRLENRMDHLAQRGADLIQRDRRDIDELRGALDMLGKRFDAIIRPAAE